MSRGDDGSGKEEVVEKLKGDEESQSDFFSSEELEETEKTVKAKD